MLVFIAKFRISNYYCRIFWLMIQVGGRSTWGPLTVSRLSILRMPSACVTVIITSHHFIKDGAGIWCHCRVTDCWVTAPWQSRNPQQTQYLLELTHFMHRLLISLCGHTDNCPRVFLCAASSPINEHCHAVLTSVGDDTNLLSVKSRSYFVLSCFSVFKRKTLKERQF